MRARTRTWTAISSSNTNATWQTEGLLKFQSHVASQDGPHAILRRVEEERGTLMRLPAAMQAAMLGLTSALMVIATGSPRVGIARPAPEAPAAPGAGGHPVPGAPRCPIFPADNVWNRDISHLPVAPNSAHMIAAIGADRGLHPDFGADASNGIPFNVVGRGGPLVRVTFDYTGESDSGPYPIPAHPLIEAGSDHHLLIVDRDRCRL